MDRMERSKLHHDLVELLTDCESDKDYFERMVYSLQIISNELTQFKDDIPDYEEGEVLA